VLPYFFEFSERDAKDLDETGQRLLNRSRIVGFATPDAAQAFHPRHAAGVSLPLPRLMDVSAANGHVNVLPDPDGALRHIELIIGLGDGLYPSMALETTRLALGLPRTRIRLAVDHSVQIGIGAAKGRLLGTLAKTLFGVAMLIVAVITAFPYPSRAAARPTAAAASAPTTSPATNPATSPAVER